jgi:hypothetical protein
LETFSPEEQQLKLKEYIATAIAALQDDRTHAEI